MNERLTEGLHELLASGRDLREWHLLPEVHAAYQRLAQDYLTDLGEPESHGEGRGIVTLGGGERYFPSIYVLLRQLQRTTELPVEVWHVGQEEMDPCMTRLCRELGATVRDIDSEDLRAKSGWSVKPLCVMRSRFREVLFIDADNAPRTDPVALFDAPQYREHGSLFWPDFANWVAYPKKGRGEPLIEAVYSAFGVPLPKHRRLAGTWRDWLGARTPDGIDVTFETGQFVLDKARCWKPLALAHHYCQHPEFYFQLVHGDTGCFRFPWLVLGQPCGIAAKMPDTTEDLAYILQHGPDGEVLFEHRNRAKWHALANARCDDRRLMLEGLGLGWMDELKRKWGSKPWTNSYPTPAERQLAERLVGGRVGDIELQPDGLTNKEGVRWSTWIDADEPLVTIRDGDKVGRLRPPEATDETGKRIERREPLPARHPSCQQARLAAACSTPIVASRSRTEAKPLLAARTVNVIAAVFSRYDCLENLARSLARSTCPPHRFWVMDRAPVRDRDRIVKAVTLGGWDANKLTVLNLEDPGTSVGVNYCMTHIGGEKILCGDDIEFEPTAIEEMLETKGCMVIPGSPQNAFACFRFSDRLYRQIGPFDETLSPRYLYFEDCDYAYRMKLAGQTWTVAQNAVVKHVSSATLKAYTKEQMADHHKRFAIAQQNYISKWGGMPYHETFLTPYGR